MDQFTPGRLLARLGRQGPRAVAALVFIAIAVPPLGALLRPCVPEAIFLLLTISFSRLNVTALRHHLRRPTLILTAILWSGIGVPLLFGLLALSTGLDKSEPGLFLGLMLQGVTSPMMAAPAMASLAGLDATLVLITLVLGTALVPVVAPLFAYAFLGQTLAMSPGGLALRLLAMLSGSCLLAGVLRRIFGIASIERHREAIDGVNILLMLVFVTAVMGDVVPRTLEHPVQVGMIALLAFGCFFILLFLTAAVFWRAGRIEALSLGLAASQRNMGLMLAATDGVLPGATWLYFALCQFPIYLSPKFLVSILAWLGDGPPRRGLPAIDTNEGGSHRRRAQARD